MQRATPFYCNARKLKHCCAVPLEMSAGNLHNAAVVRAYTLTTQSANICRPFAKTAAPSHALRSSAYQRVRPQDIQVLDPKNKQTHKNTNTRTHIHAHASAHQHMCIYVDMCVHSNTDSKNEEDYETERERWIKIAYSERDI